MWSLGLKMLLRVLPIGVLNIYIYIYIVCVHDFTRNATENSLKQFFLKNSVEFPVKS